MFFQCGLLSVEGSGNQIYENVYTLRMSVVFDLADHQLWGMIKSSRETSKFIHSSGLAILSISMLPAWVFSLVGYYGSLGFNCPLPVFMCPPPMGGLYMYIASTLYSFIASSRQPATHTNITNSEYTAVQHFAAIYFLFLRDCVMK